VEIAMDVVSMRKKLAAHGQDHLLAFYDQLVEGQQKSFLDQLAALDWDGMGATVASYVRGRQGAGIPAGLTPPDVVPVAPAGPEAAAEKEAARKRGEQLIAAGKVAAFVVAGGQGTRLGFDGPKGCLEATPVAHKPLFRLFAEKIVAASRRHRVHIPWYIMTSPATDVATKAHFRQNDFWGFSPKDVIFLMQGTMPAFSLDGKILLADKGRLALSPDGHGGSLPALRASGALEDMARRGVEVISYFQVDNPLVRCIDPLFLGLHDLRGAEMSAKAVAKRGPLERLGNLCSSGGKLHVIEYSDMPASLAEACLPDGRLKYSAGSIGVHVLSRSFIERLTEGGKCTLDFHRAEKAVPFLDAEGRLVKPDKPNAVKLERFVFDALPLARATVVLETLRSEEFSPIKNASGPDSLATSLYDQVRRWAVWMEKAGIQVPRDADGQVAAAIEISPLFAESAEELAAKVDRKLAISTGQAFYLGSRGQIGGSKSS
jgi:UDP-N-acetylglucosamine/UDP-N-acetylgalactosamine diphosphorylase